jgi:hypothetical protein
VIVYTTVIFLPVYSRNLIARDCAVPFLLFDHVSGDLRDVFQFQLIEFTTWRIVAETAKCCCCCTCFSGLRDWSVKSYAPPQYDVVPQVSWSPQAFFVDFAKSLN